MLKLKLKQKKSKVFFDGKCSNSFINVIKHSISWCYFSVWWFHHSLLWERRKKRSRKTTLARDNDITIYFSKILNTILPTLCQWFQSNQIQIQLYIYSWNGIAEMLLYLFSRNYWNWITKEKKVQRLSAFIIHFA